MNDMLSKNAIFNSIMQFWIKMKSFFACTKINEKDSKDQNANQCKMPNIFVFAI